MKIRVVNKIVLFAIVLFSMIGCTKDGLLRDELERVKSKSSDQVMPLLTVFSKQDSLFLRKDARKVDKENINSASINLLKSRMLATVNDSLNRGVGIAAPQVGVGINMILVKRLDKEGEPFEVYFNPRILEYGDSINSGTEGCLSVPGYRGQVERSQNIKISFLDSIGCKKKEEISGFTAVIFQHEIDHLSGALYYDHVNGGFPALTPHSEK
jgi:peptide deformylase